MFEIGEIVTYAPKHYKHALGHNPRPVQAKVVGFDEPFIRIEYVSPAGKTIEVLTVERTLHKRKLQAK